MGRGLDWLSHRANDVGESCIRPGEENWVFDGGHVASRFISVKPKVANAMTDIHIVSDHGNEYTL